MLQPTGVLGQRPNGAAQGRPRVAVVGSGVAGLTAAYLATANTHTWITEYIFPGGLIPSVTAIEEQLAAVGLCVMDDLAFGPHYARTLSLWRERFDRHTERLHELGFDETFRRTWNLYLANSEAGFASGYLDVHQFLITGAAERRAAEV